MAMPQALVARSSVAVGEAWLAASGAHEKLMHKNDPWVTVRPIAATPCAVPVTALLFTAAVTPLAAGQAGRPQYKV